MQQNSQAQAAREATEVPQLAAQNSAKNSNFPAGIVSVLRNGSDDRAAFPTASIPWQFPSASKPDNLLGHPAISI
jgi:hypothetical protein